VRGYDSPEDVAAETWLQVVRGLDRFTGDATAFRAFLFTVARNRAVDLGRRQAARPALLLAEPPDTATAASAEAAVFAEIATEEALALVASLPPDQAEMVMLRVVAGMDVATVADLVGKKPGTVRVTVHRALGALAREWRSRTNAQEQEVV
jgi:RNA polymerase sigma-70 factor (ECF subfamily)